MPRAEPATHDLTETTDDAFLDGAVQILQPKSGYRAGLDAVLLAAFAQALCRSAGSTATEFEAGKDEPPIKVLDVGSGVGTVGLCLASQVRKLSVVLLERDPALANLARENIKRNNFSKSARAVVGEVGCSNDELSAMNLVPNSQDIVAANPPYYPAGSGTPSVSETKARSHMLHKSQLDDWCRFMARMAKPGGWLVMVHKAEALREVLANFAVRAGNLKVLPIHPRKNEPANRIITAGKNGSRGALTLLPGFILHMCDNDFTPEAEAILRRGQALEIEQWS